MADIKKFQFILDGKIANNFKSELSKIGGTINELNDTQVVVDFNENATMANFKKLYQRLEKENSELTVQFRYDINKLMLEKAQKEMSQLEVYVDANKANKEILELANGLKNINLKLEVDGISESEEDKLFKQSEEIADKIGKIISTHISIDGSTKIFDGLSNEVKTIIESFTSLSKIKEIKPFDTKNIEKQRLDIENIKTAMSELEVKGATSFGGGKFDDSKVEELHKEIAEVKEDISSLKGRVDTLEDVTAFDTLSSKANDFGKEINTINNSVTALQKVLDPLFNGINQVYKENNGNHISGYWSQLKEEIEGSNTELKELLKSVGLYDSKSNGLKLISDGMVNSGGLIGDERVLIARKNKNDRLEQTHALKNALDEAHASGINVSRILDVIGTKESNVFLEVQEAAKGNILGNIYGQLDNDFVNTEWLEATDEQIKKLISDMIALQKMGINVESNLTNIMYDKKKGFSFIDMDLDITKFENDAELIEDHMIRIFGDLEDFYIDKNDAVNANMIAKVRKRFENLSEQVQQAYAEAQASNSPSKEFEKLENDAVDGIVVGANKNEDKLKNVGKQMADNVKDGFKEAMSDIDTATLSPENQSTVLSGGEDVQPVIEANEKVKEELKETQKEAVTTQDILKDTWNYAFKVQNPGGVDQEVIDWKASKGDDVSGLITTEQAVENLNSDLSVLTQNGSEGLNKLKERANELETSLSSVSEAVSRISKMSSIKGIPYDNFADEATEISKRLATLYDEGITDSEEFVALQYKIMKLFDDEAKAAGGVKGSGASSAAELRSWIMNFWGRKNADFDSGTIVDIIFGGKGGSTSVIDETTGKLISMKDIVADISKYGKSGWMSFDEDTRELKELNAIIEYVENNLATLQQMGQNGIVPEINQSSVLSGNQTPLSSDVMPDTSGLDKIESELEEVEQQAKETADALSQVDQTNISSEATNTVEDTAIPNKESARVDEITQAVQELIDKHKLGDLSNIELPTNESTQSSTFAPLVEDLREVANETSRVEEATKRVQSLFEESSGQLAMFEGVKEQQKEVKTTIEKTNDSIEGQITLVDYLNDKKSKPIEPIKDTFDVNTSDIKAETDAIKENTDSLKENAQAQKKQSKAKEDSSDTRIHDISKAWTAANKENKVFDTIQTQKAIKNYEELIDKLERYYSLLGQNKKNEFVDGSAEKDELETLRNQIDKASKSIDEFKGKEKELKDVVKRFKSEIKGFEEKSGTTDLYGLHGQEDVFSSLSNDKVVSGKLDTYKQKVEELRTIFLEIKNLVPIDVTNTEDADRLKILNKQFEELAQNLRSNEYNPANQLEVDRLTGRISDTLFKNTAAPREIRKEMEALVAQLKQVGLSQADVDKIRDSFSRLEAQMKATGKTGDSLGTKITKKFKDVAAYFATYVSIQDAIQVVRQGFETIKEYDTALTEMNKVSDESIDTLKEFQNESFELADSIGTTASALQNSVADWQRLGESLEDAKQSAQDANILFNVSEFGSIDEATESLVSMSQAYKELEKGEIIDVVNNLGNNFAISTDGLATALQNSASALKTAQNDFYESAALTTAANTVVQDPDKVGAGKLMPEHIVICGY